MSGQTAQWDIPVEHVPTLMIAGTSTHGEHPVERYELGDLWCIHCYHYHGRMIINGREFPIRPGCVSITAPFTTLEHRFMGQSMHRFGHFTIPKSPEASWTIPAMQDLGAHFDAFDLAFTEAIGWMSTQPARASARLWDLLWRLVAPKPSRDEERAFHPAVLQTLEAIERRLNEPLCASELAGEVGLSHSHLTRLFRKATGQTIVGYIGKRRMQRAEHLLRHSSIPIKTIAAQVGLADLQHFNKAVKRMLAMSPSAVREMATRPHSAR